MWIIERDVFEPSCHLRLLEALQSRGIPAEVVTSEVAGDLDLVRQLTGLHASCWLVTQFAASADWPSRAWGVPSDFSLAAYRPAWSPWLLNDAAERLSLAQFVWDHARVWEQWSDDRQRVFVRPDDGFKSFSGGCLTVASLGDWWEARQALMCPMDLPVWVSRPQLLMEEHRCFVVDGQVVASSRYQPSITWTEDCNLTRFVELIVATVRPPMRMLAVDVALTSAGWRVIEIGCIPCLDFYDTDHVTLTSAMEVSRSSVFP